MQAIKKIPTVYLSEGTVYADSETKEAFTCADGCSAAVYYSNLGAEALAVIEYSGSDGEHEKNLGCLRQLASEAEIPVFAGGRVRRLEDVKKYLYAGADRALYIPDDGECADGLRAWPDVLKEISERFGKDKLVFCSGAEKICRYRTEALACTGAYLVTEGSERESLLQREEILDMPVYAAVSGAGAEDQMARTEHKPAISFAELTVNGDGLIPVIVQDYRTNQVLMLAYMNGEAYENTLKTGRMTYYSRSRRELWIKGMTSGHFQYMKELTADCDKDTLLAKVSQVGAACHTGSYSCFFERIAGTDYRTADPLHVLEKEYATILDRKANPKEGSYTNYLFDKGIDKILKKVGEEASGIIIAAKNPDPEEIKYEIADFLYHAMVLMVEKGVSWEDITKEISNR